MRRHLLGEPLGIGRAGIDQHRHLEIIRQQHKFGIGAVVQLEAQIVRRQRLRDRLLGLGLSVRSNLQPLRLPFRSDPDGVALSPRSPTGDLGILLGDHQLEILLFLLLLLRLFPLHRFQHQLGQFHFGQCDARHLQVPALEFFHHHRLHLARDLRALFWHVDHGIVGHHAAHRRQQFGPHHARIEIRTDFLGKEIDLLRDGPNDDGGPQLDEKIVGAQRIDGLDKALPPDVIDEHVVPRRPPIESALQGLGRQAFGERVPAQAPLPGMHRRRTAAQDQEETTQPQRRPMPVHGSSTARPSAKSWCRPARRSCSMAAAR